MTSKRVGGKSGAELATNASGYQSVDCSPDGRPAAFGTGDGRVDIFDLNRR